MKVCKEASLVKEPKSWGLEKIIINIRNLCGKLLVVEANKKTSWHYHFVKDETFYVSKGHIKLYLGSLDNRDFQKADMKELHEGDSITIPRLICHRIEAVVNSEIFEFSNNDSNLDKIVIKRGVEDEA